MVLLIDNYDSFTYNLYQIIEELGFHCQVYRNDQIDLAEIERLAPEKIVISPGPGEPPSAGITLALIARFAGRIPILGVCLGHQAIGQAFGAQVVRAPRPKHGKVSAISHVGLGIFAGLTSPFRATRYHSLVVDDRTLPACFEVTARAEDGVIMAMRHREFQIQGVQFHPESIATEGGREMIYQFLSQEGIQCKAI